MTKRYYHGPRGGVAQLMNQTEEKNRTVLRFVSKRISGLGNGRAPFVQPHFPIFVKGVSKSKFHCYTKLCMFCRKVSLCSVNPNNSLLNVIASLAPSPLSWMIISKSHLQIWAEKN